MKLIRRFENTVNQFGSNVAVIDNRGSYTFQTLQKRAIEIAHEIEKRLCDRTKTPVMISMQESFEYLAAIMGVFYSGNYYVPLIKNSPKLGKRKIIRSINPDIIITDFETSSSLIKNRVSVSKLLIVEEISGEGEQFLPMGFRKTIDMDPAYIMHTSGSTGEPKGVIIQHRGLLDYIDWIGKTFKMNEDTIIGCNQNFGFDNSLLDIFSMVCYGSRIILKWNEKEKDQKDQQLIIQKYMNNLIEELNTYRVNLVFYTPSMLKLFANNDGFRANKPEYLKQVLFCGEVMPNKQLNYWRKHLPTVQYANLYGPTEITDVCTYYIVDRDFDDDELLPIGGPCENTDILILNEQGKSVKIGEIGEILVRGAGVSCGYWKNPEKTAAVFIQNPLHDNYRDFCYRTGDLGTYNDRGEILFTGRKDSQIQFHGLRLELGEIETALNLMKSIKNCAVFYVDAKEKIVVFYEAEQKIPKIDIMRFLYDKIPVMPAEFIHLDQFPINTNGKVDRKKLSEKLTVLN